MMSTVNTKRIVSPALDQIDSLRQPLTSGERQILHFLNDNLPQEWEIYIQPHMNGLCPDFVLLHPGRGLQIIEVKDWSLGAMPSRWEPRGKRAMALFRQNSKGKWFRVKDEPISKLSLYEQEIVDLYCPRLGASLAGRFNGGIPCLAKCIAMPNESHEKILEFLGPSLASRNIDPVRHASYWPVLSADVLAHGDIETAVPAVKPGSYNLMNEDYAKDMRSWLSEPDLKAEQRQPLQLDARQKELAESRTVSGYRRVRGAAGSGKSQVLAGKAAKSSLEDKKVLVITFNITLGNYLRDLIVRGGLRYSGSRVMENITVLNFHRWAKRFCTDTANSGRYNALWDGDEQFVLNEGLANLVLQIAEEEGDWIRQYDVVLVDEGQDFRLSWWSALHKVAKQNAELVLVADKTQNLYGTAAAWTDVAMSGAGFSGPWTELNVTYRLPTEYIPFVVDFANRFIPATDRILPISTQQGLGLEPVHMHWTQTSGDTNALCADRLAHIVTLADENESGDELVFSDIVFMASSNDAGLDVVTRASAKNISINHTFDGNKDKSRRQKMGFYLGSEKVKATTIHSFKGLEARLLVLQIDPVSGSQDEHVAAVYAALTRLKISQSGGSYIAVVCSDPMFRDYGKTWVNYVEM